MPVRVDPLFDYSAIDAFTEFVEAFPELAAEVVGDAFQREIEPGLLEELRTYPGPSLNSLNSSLPFKWSEDPEKDARGRRWWFANFQEGRERTGALAAAYEVDTLIGDGTVFMSVRNNNKGYKWVKGKRQIPGHKRTGWQLDKPTIDFWAEATKEVIYDAVIDLVQEGKF